MAVAIQLLFTRQRMFKYISNTCTDTSISEGGTGSPDINSNMYRANF